MTAPTTFTRLPPGVRCKCMQLWSEADGSLWCCGAKPIENVSWDSDARRLKIASELWERFCSDLRSDAGMARTRLIAGIQCAIRDGVP